MIAVYVDSILPGRGWVAESEQIKRSACGIGQVHVPHDQGKIIGMVGHSTL